MLTNLQSLVQHCLAWEWTATHRRYSHTHMQTHKHTLQSSYKRSYRWGKIKRTLKRIEEKSRQHTSIKSVCVCVYGWPTCVYESSWCAFAELFGLVRQSDLDDPGDVSGRRLHPDGMRRDQLKKEGKGGPRVSTQEDNWCRISYKITVTDITFLCKQTSWNFMWCSRGSAVYIMQ